MILFYWSALIHQKNTNTTKRNDVEVSATAAQFSSLKDDIPYKFSRTVN